MQEMHAGDTGLIPGWGRSSGEGNSNPLQYSCLEKSHGHRSLVTYSPWGLKKSQMQLTQLDNQTNQKDDEFSVILKK